MNKIDNLLDENQLKSKSLKMLKKISGMLSIDQSFHLDL